MQLRPTTSAPAARLYFFAPSSGVNRRASRPRDGARRSRPSAAWSARITSSAISASPSHEIVSATMKSTPASTAQPTCSSNIARTCGARRRCRRSKILVLQILPATSASPSAATFLAIGQRRAVHRLEIVLPADQPQFFAMRVIGEGLDHVGAGAQEIAMQVLDLLGEVEHDLRHVGARLQVAAPLQLEEVALGANHRSRGKPFEKTRLRHRFFPFEAPLCRGRPTIANSWWLPGTPSTSS